MLGLFDSTQIVANWWCRVLFSFLAQILRGLGTTRAEGFVWFSRLLVLGGCVAATIAVRKTDCSLRYGSILKRRLGCLSGVVRGTSSLVAVPERAESERGDPMADALQLLCKPPRGNLTTKG